MARAARPAAHVLLPRAGHHHAAARARPGHGAVHRVGGRPDGGALAVLRLQEAAARRRRRPAADVGGGALVAPAVPRLRLSAAGGLGGRARPYAHPRRRRLAERRVAVDQPRRAAGPALGDCQARPGGMGRRPAGPQGEAGSAGRLAAHPRAPHARRGRALPARDVGRRPGHHVHPAGYLPGAAVGHRHPRTDLQRRADPDDPGDAPDDRLGEVPLPAPGRLPRGAGQRYRHQHAIHPGQVRDRLGRLVRRGPGLERGEVGVGAGIDH